MYEITFLQGGKTYLYHSNRVQVLDTPTKLDIADCHINLNGYRFPNATALYRFSGCQRTYYCVIDGDTDREFNADELHVEVSCLADKQSKSVFDYFKEVALKAPLKSDEDESLLDIQYRNVHFVGKGMAAAPYLNPKSTWLTPRSLPELIFPFGCNASQKQSVENAFTSQISVIQGPPGTGKTQTILNIIANLVVMKKTVLVVSNNNSATENVLEKLQKNKMGFIAAMMGKSDNKLKFISSQPPDYPEEMYRWGNAGAGSQSSLRQICEWSQELDEVFRMQHSLADGRHKLKELQLEREHFLRDINPDMTREKEFDDYSADEVMQLIFNIQQKMDAISGGNGLRGKLRIWLQKLMFTLKKFFHVKGAIDIPDDDMPEMVTSLQGVYYDKYQQELQNDIYVLEQKLAKVGADDKLKRMTEASMKYLKYAIYDKYHDRKKKIFTMDRDSDGGGILLWKDEGKEFLDEYPVVTSTTFSSVNALCRNAKFDYVIMDEASQVSVETGALALMCAENAVIVGDMMQLPNVVGEKEKDLYESLFRKYDIDKAYDCANNSFLKSVIGILPDAPDTMLREHYRCHPKIINFCNQKFYHGQLVIMTKDDGERDVMSVMKVESAKNSTHSNDRELESIREEILPGVDGKDIGIITPYNNQKQLANDYLRGIGVTVDTVHKFQGKENDTIIMSTTCNFVKDYQMEELSDYERRNNDFVDNANLLNVAVSRAKKRFIVVTSGDYPPKNIADLIKYIEYNNFTVEKSKIYSIFDLLYERYNTRRLAFMKHHKVISEFDSENLVYGIVEDVINEGFSQLKVSCHYPLRLLLRDYSLLSDVERRYATRRGTHLDILISDRVTHSVVMAIEIDGYQFHKEGTEQHERDKLKNHILEVYGIPLLRVSTRGTNEKEKIKDFLSAITSTSKP